MKKILTVFTLIFALLVPAGCKTATQATPQTLAPGYTSQADQSIGETLVGAHAFYVSIQQDVASGKYTPSASEKASLNSFAAALNAAQALYISYHAGQATLAQVQTATSLVTAQQTSLQTSITGGK